MTTPCFGCAATARPMTLPRPAIDDDEGARVPAGLPPVVDAHVHLFPPRVFEAVWRWFDRHGWPIRYRLHAEQTLAYLLDRGVDHVVGLAYAHKPGVARAMNETMAALVAAEPRLTGLATVHPDDPDPRAVLVDAFAAGLRGVKLHCHVQAMSPDDPRLAVVYEECAARGLPVVIHAGREPKSDAYPVDPHALCRVDRTAAVLRAFPTLKLLVPHCGADEFEGYARLLETHDHLWVDTTMMLGGYFPVDDPWLLLRARPDRVLYGTDFPNLPYAWDREIVAVAKAGLDDDRLVALLSGNARALYGL